LAGGYCVRLNYPTQAVEGFYRWIMKNVISFDLEDWFCTYNLSHIIKKNEWANYESRVFNNTLKLLNILSTFNMHGTFFVLGWIAERMPDLIRTIENTGNEIALHGYDHQLLTQMTPEEFESDIEKSLNILNRCNLKNEIIGYRAPSFTITPETLWAIKILEKFNFKYDSSVFPTGLHPDYGMESSPLSPYMISEKLIEFPLSSIEIFGKKVPFGGGAYFRILPFLYNKYCINKVNSLGRPVIFYLHPWEIDPDQPRLKLPILRYTRQYYNLKHTENKLKILLSKFKFTTIKESLEL
jgi:polysaccharide deacetylase family protein (PEP-CTERM system associated)